MTITGLRSRFLLVASLFLTAIVPAHADKRVALVVGNSAYQHVVRLDNPANDAKLIAAALRALGFTLVGKEAQLDLDKPGIDHAVQAFGDLLQGADVGLFYYAGHGVQVRGENYLVPIDANPGRESDVDFQMLNTNLVLRQMEEAGTKLNLVMLDACRNNPFGGRGLRAMSGGGLAQMQAPEGTLISFATQPGNVASDGADGDSPYSKALAETIRRPGLDIFRTFNEVGLAVIKATANRQQPWLATSPIKGDFYFSMAPDASRPAAAGEPSQQALQAANELLAIMSTDMVNQLSEQTTNIFWPELAQTFRTKSVDEDTIGELRTAFQRMLVDFVVESLKDAPEIYARHFSAAELHDLAAFYRTPIGAVALHELPRLAAEINSVMLARGPALEQQASETFLSILRAHGYVK